MKKYDCLSIQAMISFL